MAGGIAFIVVGHTGMGKSFFIKEVLKKAHPSNRIVYDKQKEYGDLYPLPFDPNFNRWAKILPAATKKVIVIEEASIFLSNRGYNQDVVDALVSKRHQENVFFLVYHTIRAVPKYLFDYCDYMVLYKTNDRPEMVEAYEHNGILNAYKEIKASKFLHAPNGKRYSDHKVIQILEDIPDDVDLQE